MENLLRLAALGLALLCLAATNVRACGPTFPNNLLDLGDNAVLLAPVAEFERELERMKLAPARFHAVPVPREKNFSDQTADAEMSDLSAALRKTKLPRKESERILAAHQVERDKLKTFIADYETWGARDFSDPDKGARPKFPKFEFATGLPAEFADYFDGALAWHNPALADKSMAREPWERLLARPEAERKFKSTWAAFMLGKSWDGIEPAKAAGYFRQVRELAAHGFKDSLGLAAASYGLEARAYFRGANYAEAIKLYLDQLATADDTATASLLQVAAAAIADTGALSSLATNAVARQVITAYVISSHNMNWSNSGDELNPTNSITGAWLSAVEEAEVTDVESAEKLALAAYQAGAFDVAQRWIARASNAPVAQWIQAKLLLRDGKIEPAAALLAKVTKLLPVATGAEQHGKSEFADDLFMKFSQYDREDVPARRQLLGELGVLRLSRGEFTQALDALLRAGFWMDASYVAERVLTVEELKDYVDRNWPRIAREERVPQRTSEDSTDGASETEPTIETEPTSPVALGKEIRYLLARRLTREIHGDVAREYYPAQWQPNFDALATELVAGWDETQPAEQRAASLFAAACIARTNGMELLGTEVQPDWHVHDGNYQEGVTWENRIANARRAMINVATAHETTRASQHRADPEERFHYRYQAAFLGLRAAKLMPNNSDDTAFVLWQSGCWLKDRDPETADIFYKSLVRRCRKTALGAAADVKRWFPELDENRNLVETSAPEVTEPSGVLEDVEPAPPPPDDAEPDESNLVVTEIPDVTEVPHGCVYVVQPGDTLAAITRNCNRSGVSISLEDVFNANPGIEPGRLQVGQKLLLPTPKER